MKVAHLLDASALLAHLLREPGEETVHRCLSNEGGRAAVCVPTWVEFQVAILHSDYAKRDAEKIVAFYSDALGLPLVVDQTVGKAAVVLQEVCSPQISLSDLLVAGCAKAHGLTLVYRETLLDGIPDAALPQIKLPQRQIMKDEG